MRMKMDKEAYGIDDVCRVANMGRTTVYEEIRKKRLIARKCGARTVVLKADLARFLESLPVRGS